MDKFGIFNLLNSLLDYYGNKDTIASDNKTNIATPTKTETDIKTPETKNNKSSFSFSIINTMTSHDEFVKRVYKNNLPHQ